MEQKYFQGSFDLNPYFEGWYFKVVTPDQKRMFAWIPSISFTEKKKGYIQVLDSDETITDTVEFPISNVSFPSQSFIQIGDNCFKEDQIILNLKTIQHHYTCDLKLYSPTLLKQVNMLLQLWDLFLILRICSVITVLSHFVVKFREH